MYSNILIPTDGSELAGKAVQHGIALAKRIGARITALTVLPPFHTFTTDPQMIEDTPDQYKVRMQQHADKTLGAVAQAAQEAGVACETVQVEHEHPYRAIIDTASRLLKKSLAGSLLG
jgi:nucleotide-binding universal stress UspA family protein